MADFHPISISHAVEDLDAARAFMVEALGFVLAESRDDWALFDNGSLAIRLLKATGRPSAPFRLELTTRDVGDTADELERRAEVRSRTEERWPSAERCEVSIEVQDWLELVIFRAYDEDELDIVPELPTTLQWSAGADDILRQLLRRLPLPFRDRARTRSVEGAERLASRRGESAVEVATAIKALAEVTPQFQHAALREALVELEVKEATWSRSLREPAATKAMAGSALEEGYPEKSCEVESLITHSRFVKATLARRKTQQRRDGLYALPGETFELEGVSFRVTSVERQKLGAISEQDAQREGFPNLSMYRELIERMHSGMPWDEDALVWVHSFERLSSS